MAKKSLTRTAARTPAREAVKAPSLKPKSPGASTARRADFKQPGSTAIDRMPEPHRSIARAADRAIRAAVPGAVSLVKWGNACYYRDERAFAALMPTRTGVNLALPGTLIPDPDKLLEGTGRVMRHVKLHDAKLARSEPVRRLIVAASKVGLDGM